MDDSRKEWEWVCTKMSERGFVRATVYKNAVCLCVSPVSVSSTAEG